jgi:hypothetical protein
MCLACEQDAIWLSYLESRGLLQSDDPAAVEALFGAFPVQPLPVQGEGAEQRGTPTETANNKSINNPFSCDDPTAE